MAGPVAAWGIDIGKCALKALRLRPGADGKVEIIGHETIEHATILSKAEGNRQALINEALEKFLSRHDISKDRIAVGVPGQHTLARFSKLPPVEPKKIPDIVRYEADQQIPFDLDEVIWDYQTFQEPDSPDIEVGIFAMKRELVREHLLPFQQAGIEPVIVQSTPLSLYNAMRFEGRISDEAVVLLDIGADNTDLVISTSIGLWSRTIPLGGNKFTDVLVKSFKLSFSKAENLKRTAATSKYARQVFQAMRPVFAELVQELSRSLGFYRSTHRDAELKRIIGIGNAFALPGLQKYLQQNLQMPVERPEGFKKAVQLGGGDKVIAKEDVPSFMVAYGLALQGISSPKVLPEAAPVQSNLLPPEIVKLVVWKKKRPYFAAAAACLALAAGTIWFRQFSDRGMLSSASAATVSKMNYQRASEFLQRGPTVSMPPRQEALTWLEVAKAFETEINQYRNKGSEEQEKAKLIVDLQRRKAVWPRILMAVHEALPEGEGPLATADSEAKYRAAIKNDKTGELQRPQRREIFIERLEAEYLSNVDEEDLLDVERGDSGAEVIKPSQGEARPGFVIHMVCRTPNAGKLRFIDETIRKNLRERGRQPGQGFYINRVVLTKARSFLDDDKDTSSPPPDRGRGRGRGSTETKSLTRTMFDPVTAESMESDWVFELSFDVVLADLPQVDDPTADGSQR